MSIYKVSLEYIVETVVPQYLEQIGRLHRKKSYAIGFRPTNLVGANAERMLKERIAKDFPESEHISMWRWERIQDIVANRTEDEFTTSKGKGIADYSTLGQYVRAYRGKVQNKREIFDREMNRSTNKKRPYRDNPFLA